MMEAERAWKEATPQERLTAMEQAGFIGDHAYAMAVKSWTALPTIVRVQLELKAQARFAIN